MVEQNEFVIDVLKGVQSLRSFLKSEIYISNPDEGVAIARIKVYNAAPESYDGSNIIFLGVGLRFINSTEDSKVRDSAYSPSKIRKFRPTDRLDLRQQYDEGIWLTRSFPDVTEDELSHGEALFPGETVAYELEIPEGDLPHLDIRVEGSVSRRHLLHISQSIGPQNPQKNKVADAVDIDNTQINEWFNAVDKIDFSTPLVAIASEVSDLGPQTTLADIEKLKALIEKGITHIEEVREEMNKDGLYNSTPNEELQYYIKEGVGKYLLSAEKAFDKAKVTLSSGDMEQMKQAIDEMKTKLLKIDVINHQRADLISWFCINNLGTNPL